MPKNVEFKNVIDKIKYDFSITQLDIAKRLNVNKSYISDMINGRVPFTDSMREKLESVFGIKCEHSCNNTNRDNTPDSLYRLVPIIHIDSVGGMRSSNAIVEECQYVEGYVPFMDAREGDLAIYQSGNSMNPTIPPGSLMQIREVENWREYFGYGNIFVIELSDGRRITKEITRYEPNPSDYVWCISHNPDVPDEELPKSMIVSVWKVMKILTNKGW